MERNVVRLVAGVMLVAGVASVADDTMVSDSAKTWGDATLWQSATVPNGPGVIVDTGNGGREIYMDETNRVVGGITSTYGTMPANGGTFTFSNMKHGFQHDGGDLPQTSAGYIFSMPTSTLTFDNNGSAAYLRIDDGNTTATQRQPYRYLIDVPVILKDSLAIDCKFAGLSQYGAFTTGQGNGPLWTVGFGRPVAGAGGLSVTCAAALNSVALIGNDNTFTGDVTVTRGLLRALDTSNLPRAGTPFGVSNTITAVAGDAGIDLGGFRTGKGQKLVLKGERVCSGGTRGVLFSSWARPDAYAAWEGAVELAGDTRIGGPINGNGYPNNFYPNDASGAFEISGPISDQTTAAALTVDNLDATSPVILSGTNTFSGGLHLLSGALSARGEKAFGTGGVYFDGGRYLYDSDNSANIFTADVNAGTGNMIVSIDAGVTATAHTNAFVRLAGSGKYFCKYGAGTLVVTNYVHAPGHVYLYGGTVAFDTTYSSYAKFGESASWAYDYAHLYDDLRLVARGNPSVVRTAGWYGNIEAGAGLTFRAEDNQKFEMHSNTGDALMGYANLETDGSEAYFTLSKATGTHTYANDASFMVWNRRTWVYTTSSGSRVYPVTDDMYVTDWTAATGKLVDVTPAVAAGGAVPAGTTADGFRFNTPNGGTEIVLTLAGDLSLAGHTILVTPEMGTTPIRITGGAIKGGGLIRILNFNTNATLTIESDLAVETRTQLATGGPGTTILKGAKTFNDLIYVVGGRLLGTCADSFGTANSQWNSGYVFISCGGAIGPAPGCSFNPVLDAKNGRGELGLNVVNSSFGIHTPAGSEFVLTQNGLPSSPYFFKDGPGQLTCTNKAQISWMDIREGSVRAVSCAEGRGRLRVRDGAVLKGGVWVTGYQSVSNGGGSDSDAQGKRTLEVNGRVTVDLNANASANKNTGYDTLQNTTEYFSGDGELVITNSRGTAVTWNVEGYHDWSFRGTITPYVTVSGKGFQMPRATLNLPAAGSYSCAQNSDDRRSFRVARLTGTGPLTIVNTQTKLPSYVWLGGDDVADADYSGTMDLQWGGNICGAPILMKLGTNNQRISGANNGTDGSVVVRNGGLLAGNDSPAVARTGGAFGYANIYVGDEGTPADGVPSFLIDGAYAVSNAIRVAGSSPATALPTIGGTANADGAVFGGKLTLDRDAAVHAAAGTTVKFAGTFVANGHALAKTGAGTVDLATATAVPLDVREGTFAVSGDLTIPEGTPLRVDASVCTKENKGREFVVVRAAGRITGRFDLETEIPSGWSLRYRVHEIVLCEPKGTLLFLR